MAELAAKAREQMSAAAAVDEDAEAPGAIAALPSPPRGFTPHRRRNGTTSMSTRPTWW